MASTIREEAVLELIGLAYDAAMRSDLWIAFLQRFADAVGGAAVTLSPRFARPGDSGEFVYFGFDPEFMNSYAQHYFQCDPGYAASINLPEGNCGFHTDLGLDEKTIIHSEYFNDWLRPQQLMATPSIGCLLRRDEVGPLSFFGCYRPRGARVYGRNELRLVRTLIPHMQRALQINDRLRLLHGQETVLADVLDRLPTGVLVLDRKGQVGRLNRRAEEILGWVDGLVIERRQVRAAHDDDHRTLRHLIADALRSGVEPENGSGGVLALRRPSGRRPLQVLVTPLGGRARELLNQRNGVLIFVADPETTPLPTAESLRRLYDLTPAQARLGLLLSDGKSLQEAADALQVTMHTARAHLRELFSKTDTHRQGELIRAILLAPAFRPHD